MTVRRKTEIYRALNGADVSHLLVASVLVGELQLQVEGSDGTMVDVFIPSSAGMAEPRLVNLLAFAPPKAWRGSKSLMAAIRNGHIKVLIKKESK